jgi:hypothetical protein
MGIYGTLPKVPFLLLRLLFPFDSFRSLPFGRYFGESFIQSNPSLLPTNQSDSTDAYPNPRMQMDGMNPSTKAEKVKVKRGRSPEGMRRQRLRNELRKRAYEALLRLREGGGTIWDPERHEKIATKECWVSPFLWLCQGEVLTAPFYASPSWIRLRSLARAYEAVGRREGEGFDALPEKEHPGFIG